MVRAITRRPTEIISGLTAAIVALVTWGVLDEPTGAWIIAGLAFVPGAVTFVVEWWRKRPGGTS